MLIFLFVYVTYLHVIWAFYHKTGFEMKQSRRDCDCVALIEGVQ